MTIRMFKIDRLMSWVPTPFLFICIIATHPRTTEITLSRRVAMETSQLPQLAVAQRKPRSSVVCMYIYIFLIYKLVFFSRRRQLALLRGDRVVGKKL